jgi:hypothetical protein
MPGWDIFLIAARLQNQKDSARVRKFTSRSRESIVRGPDFALATVIEAPPADRFD